MKTTLVTALSFLIYFTMPLPALAAPAISSSSGNFSQGAQIVISGSGFGSKSPSAAPLLWDDFETGSAGSPLTSPRVGSWKLGTSTPPVRSSSEKHSGTLSAYGSSRGGLHSEITATVPDERYFTWSFWFWYDHEQCVEQCDTSFCCGQTKLMQLWGNCPLGENQICPSTDYAPGVMSGGASADWFISYVVTESGAQPGGTTTWSGGAPSRRDWHRFDAILKQSDNNTANGSVELLLDQTRVFFRNNIATREMGRRWAEAIFFYGFTNWNNLFVERYLDDVYFDSSWARVELCDTPTWAARQHCEIQAPVSWTDSSIMVTASSGSFGNGTHAYLFVEDSSGAMSPGFEVVVGSNPGGVVTPTPADGLAPAAPDRLRVN